MDKRFKTIYQQNQRRWCFLTAFLSAVCLLTSFAPSLFASTLSDAQNFYDKGNVAEALEKFQQVQYKDPNETTLLYNQANCHYKLDQTDLAVELFQKVLSQSNDPSLQAKAHFNLGNCSFRQATSQESPELQEALKQLQTAVKHYRQTLTLNPNDVEAKHNIALACQLMAQIVEQIKQQEKQQQEDQEKKEDLAEKIRKLLEQQNDLIKNTDAIQQAQQLGGADPNMIINFQQQLFSRQIDLKDSTSAVQGEVQQMQAQQQQAASPPTAPSVYETVNNEMLFSVDNQAQAADDLNTRKLPDAIANQRESAQHLQNALDALKQDQEENQQQQQQNDQDKKEDSENKQDESKQNDSEKQNDQDKNQKNQKNQQNQQEQQEQQEQSEQDQQDQSQQMQDQTDQEAEPLDMTAQQILDKEKERQQQKQRIILRGSQAVEKNW